MEFLKKIEIQLSKAALSYLNGKQECDSFIRKEVKTALVNFCFEFLPKTSDSVERREFYSRLRSTLYRYYSDFPDSFVSASFTFLHLTICRMYPRMFVIRIFFTEHFTFACIKHCSSAVVH